MMHRV